MRAHRWRGAPIELRSDTFTQPTPAMRRAIAEAAVGDDAYGEDPQVARLEDRCARLFGKPAAVFTCAGTMSNQLALRAHTDPGDEVLLEQRHHVNYYESAQAGALAGVALHPVETGDGVVRSFDIERALASKPRGETYADLRLVCLENTMGTLGGTIFPYDVLVDISQRFRPEIAVYLDGARIVNASAATGIPLAEYARHVDTISMCFAKGLGAPFGSVLMGEDAAIERVRRFRKWYGGGLHQSGLMAAAALHGLDHHLGRIAEDHRNARLLVDLLREEPRLGIDRRQVQSNMVLIDVTATGLDAAEFAAVAARAGVEVLAMDEKTVRAVTHLDVGREDVHRAAAVLVATARSGAVDGVDARAAAEVAEVVEVVA